MLFSELRCDIWGGQTNGAVTYSNDFVNLRICVEPVPDHTDACTKYFGQTSDVLKADRSTAATSFALGLGSWWQVALRVADSSSWSDARQVHKMTRSLIKSTQQRCNLLQQPSWRYMVYAHSNTDTYQSLCTVIYRVGWISYRLSQCVYVECICGHFWS